MKEQEHKLFCEECGEPCAEDNEEHCEECEDFYKSRCEECGADCEQGEELCNDCEDDLDDNSGFRYKYG